eukprot:760312-Hanusia_phi.AAC.3
MGREKGFYDQSESGEEQFVKLMPTTSLHFLSPLLLLLLLLLLFLLLFLLLSPKLPLTSSQSPTRNQPPPRSTTLVAASLQTPPSCPLSPNTEGGKTASQEGCRIRPPFFVK